MDIAPAIITLTTDFGLQDPYVGQVKGAVLKEYRSATIIDITHAIPAWDVGTAAVTIRTSYAFFPAGSVHLIVVDPGVGSQRAILIAQGDGHFFIAPDNGILSLLVADGKIETIHRLEHSLFFPKNISSTFHGRDVMAPLAATLARGCNPSDLGPLVSSKEITLSIVPTAILEANCLNGQVQHIDHFGNIRTTIRVGPGYLDSASFDFLEIGTQRINRLDRTYAEVASGELLALVDSSGFLEIAANQASAADRLGCRLGDQIILHLVRK
jgi:S-adenosylmethionine hydrolase